MSRPLYRGISGIRISDHKDDESWDSQMKDKYEKEDLEKKSASDQSLLFPFKVLLSDSNANSPSKVSPENGELINLSSPRGRHKLTLLLLRLSLLAIAILAITGSFWWTMTISTSARGEIVHNYRRLQEQLVSDLWELGELYLVSSKSKDLDICSEESENHVPCFNITENLLNGFAKGTEHDRHCGLSASNCLVLPPQNYRVPHRWPTGKDVIWFANVNITAQEVLSSGSLTKRMMMLDREQISFRSDSLLFDGVEDYSHQIAEMIGLRNESYLVHTGVRTILDIGCGYGSFGAHLLSKEILTMCIAGYEPSGSQVQVTLERGLPAIIGSFVSKQLPFPHLSFDMLHCARCEVNWDKKDGIFLIEADRLLRPGGFFVFTSPLTNARHKGSLKRFGILRQLAENLCWELVSQQDITVIWRKTSDKSCYSKRGQGSTPPLCGKSQDIESSYYRPLQPCIAGVQSKRWLSITNRRKWPDQCNPDKNELELYGLHPEEVIEDGEKWRGAVKNYWSLLSPLIFSDHPKRPGDEDPSPPYNMLRNVLDMNAHLGGFNTALLESKKSVWVMNVVPVGGTNFLPLIKDRGFVGTLHDWCEAFPSYPRTYDLVHADGLLTLQSTQQRKCTMVDLFIEIDRLLRPEGWLIIRDTIGQVEQARGLTTRMKWEARVIEIENNSEEKLLMCQKPFLKRQA